MEQNSVDSHHSTEPQEQIISGRKDMKEEIENLKEKMEGDTFNQIDGWKDFEKKLASLGLVKRDTEKYLSSVALMHGSEVMVRRANLEDVFSSLENGKDIHIKRLDNEPNAALLGSEHKEEGLSKISGIEATLEGGFGWLVSNKVAGVFGFTMEHSHIKVSELDKNSPSLTKKYGEVMKGVEGNVSGEDILFIFLRIHKSVYPEDLCEDIDFNETTGEINPFILRVYAKNHQTH